MHLFAEDFPWVVSVVSVVFVVFVVFIVFVVDVIFLIKKNSIFYQEKQLYILLTKTMNKEVIKPGHPLYKLLEYSIQIDSTYLLNAIFTHITSKYYLLPTCIVYDSSISHLSGRHERCHTLLLFKAIQFDAINCIKWLIANGTCVDCFPTKKRYVQMCEVFPYTPLHYAVDIEMYNSAEMLLKNGIMNADPNIPANVSGVIKTPLNAALNRCNEKLANLLLEHGANSLNTKNTFDDLVATVTSNGAQPRKNFAEAAKQNIFARILGAENKRLLDEFAPGGYTKATLETTPDTAGYKSSHFSPFNYFAAMATLRGELIMPRILDKQFAAFIWANAEIVSVAKVLFTEQKNKNSFMSYLPHDMILVITGYIILDIILGLQIAKTQ